MKKNLDDVLKKFNKEVEKAVSPNRHYWEGTEKDNIYNVDIHIWRKPGMGNSLQTISGNKVSILTATTSFLATLLIQKVVDEEILDEIQELLEPVHITDISKKKGIVGANIFYEMPKE